MEKRYNATKNKKAYFSSLQIGNKTNIIHKNSDIKLYLNHKKKENEIIARLISLEAQEALSPEVVIASHSLK